MGVLVGVLNFLEFYLGEGFVYLVLIWVVFLFLFLVLSLAFVLVLVLVPALFRLLSPVLFQFPGLALFLRHFFVLVLFQVPVLVPVQDWAKCLSVPLVVASRFGEAAKVLKADAVVVMVVQNLCYCCRSGVSVAVRTRAGVLLVSFLLGAAVGRAMTPFVPWDVGVGAVAASGVAVVDIWGVDCTV